MTTLRGKFKSDESIAENTKRRFTAYVTAKHLKEINRYCLEADKTHEQLMIEVIQKIKSGEIK